MDETELAFIEGLLRAFGLHKCDVHWYDFPIDGTCRVGYVAPAGHAVTVSIDLRAQSPAIIGYDVGWPAG
jgi:hypothetical protein